MALAIYQSVAQDSSGNALASPTVEVRRESDNGLASLFSDRAGSTSIGNPFTGNSDGTFSFFVVGDAYKITVTQGATTRTLRYVAIGTAAEHDEGDTRVLYYDVKVDFGAVGDGSTDDTAAIQDALDTVPAGSTLYFPEGFYMVEGSGTSALTRNLPINIFGQGFGNTGLMFTASVPNTRSMLTFAAPFSSYQGIHISDMGFYAQTKGLDLLRIDAGSNLIYGCLIEQCYFTEPDAGFGVHTIDNVAYSTIQRCNIAGIWLEDTGDGFTIRENVIGGSSHCILATFTVGAGGFVVMSNVIAGTAGHVVIRNGVAPVIAFNEFETPVSVANTHNFLVDIGSTNSPPDTVLGALLIGNQYSVLTGTSDPVPIKIRTNVEGAQIRENKIFNQTGSHVVIDSGAVATVFDRSVLCYAGATSVQAVVSDSGVRTSFLAPQMRLFLSANQTGTDTASAQVWFPGAGANSLTLRAGAYEFEGLLMVSKTAGTTSRTIGMNFGGSATFSAIAYEAVAVSVDSTIFSGVQNPVASYVETASNQTVYGIASTSANQLFLIKVRGTMRLSGGGSIIPQFQYSAAPGGAPTVRANSFFKVWESS